MLIQSINTKFLHESGEWKNWWSAESLKRYNKKKQCVIDQYSAFKDKQTGLNLNVKVGIGEIIGDNGGIREAYQAYGKQNEIY